MCGICQLDDGTMIHLSLALASFASDVDDGPEVSSQKHEKHSKQAGGKQLPIWLGMQGKEMVGV